MPPGSSSISCMHLGRTVVVWSPRQLLRQAAGPWQQQTHGIGSQHSQLVGCRLSVCLHCSCSSSHACPLLPRPQRPVVVTNRTQHESSRSPVLELPSDQACTPLAKPHATCMLSSYSSSSSVLELPFHHAADLLSHA